MITTGFDGPRRYHDENGEGENEKEKKRAVDEQTKDRDAAPII